MKESAMRTLVGILSLGCVVVLVATRVRSQEEKPRPQAVAQANKEGVPKVTEEQPMSFWMEKKLDFSKSILEALTTGDHDRMAADAEQMRMLGRIEGFVRRKNADYRMQMRTFELANQELVRQAKRKNTEGALLAFNQLTASCVACHALLREGVE
jgi:cytochrome c556